MTRDEARELLLPYALNELDTETQQAVRLIVEQDEALRKEAAKLVTTVALLSDTLHDSPAPARLSPERRQRIMDAGAAPPQPRTQKLTVWQWLTTPQKGVGVLAAAAILLVIVTLAGLLLPATQSAHEKARILASGAKKMERDLTVKFGDMEESELETVNAYAFDASEGGEAQVQDIASLVVDPFASEMSHDAEGDDGISGRRLNRLVATEDSQRENVELRTELPKPVFKGTPQSGRSGERYDDAGIEARKPSIIAGEPPATKPTPPAKRPLSESTPATPAPANGWYANHEGNKSAPDLRGDTRQKVSSGAFTLDGITVNNPGAAQADFNSDRAHTQWGIDTYRPPVEMGDLPSLEQKKKMVTRYHRATAETGDRVSGLGSVAAEAGVSDFIALGAGGVAVDSLSSLSTRRGEQNHAFTTASGTRVKSEKREAEKLTRIMPPQPDAAPMPGTVEISGKASEHQSHLTLGRDVKDSKRTSELSGEPTDETWEFDKKDNESLAQKLEELREREVDEAAKPATHFRAYGVNPVYATVDRPFSTFSIDVDTASYALARRYMSQGFLPPAEAVRTEEFVNFFDYGYKAPLHRTFKIYADCAPARFGRGLHLLKIGVKGRRLGREEQRRAILTFLIDTSGSMDKSDRIELVQQSLRLLVSRLAPDDRVAIIQYASHARVVLEHTPVRDRKKLLAAIDALQCGGSTNLEEGMQRAYRLAATAFVAGGENRVLLLSDGVANLGTGDATDILKQVERFRKQGITCSVFGFGMGTYDDEMLETLANKGDGSYTFIDSDEEARRVFVDDLAATLNTIASDVKIQVEFNPKRVQRYRQLGYENRQLAKEDFRNDAVDAGEVGSGQSVTALYEVQLAAGGTREPLGTVRVRYRRVDTGAVEEIACAVRSSDVLPRFDDADARFRVATCAAEFAEILRGSPYASGSDYADVAGALRPAALALDLDQTVQELLRLVQGAGSMSRRE